MTIDDPIKCFACGGKHFVRDCPNPDERKGKGKSKGKGSAQGKASDGGDAANGGRSVYEFDIKGYWQGKKGGAKGYGKNDMKAQKGDGKGERKGKGKGLQEKRYWKCACEHTVAPPPLFPQSLGLRCPNCSGGIADTFSVECNAWGVPLPLAVRQMRAEQDGLDQT